MKIVAAQNHPKIIVAPGSYKGSIKSAIAAKIIEEEVKDFFPLFEIRKVILADGG